MALPSGYTQLAYISSSAAQYIDTGYKATSENYRIKCKFATVNDETSTVLFGGGASTDIISALLQSTNQVKFYVGSGSVSGATATFVRGAECELECHANTGTFTVNLDGVAYSGSYSGTINKDYPLFIFANNVSGTASQFSSIRLYAFQIYDNGNMVRNYVPCTNGAGVVGMYDTVGEKFYGSATSTPFIAGPRVGKVRLEYIEGTGTQRINTGLVVNDTDTYSYQILANFTNDGWGGADGYLQFKGSVAQNRLAWITVNYNGSTKAETVFVDGVQQSSSDWSTLGYSNVLIEIFAMGAKNNVAGTYKVQTGKVYACKITKGGTLVRDYIPYEVDGEVGLWDNVTQTFYTNSGTGSFAGGPVAEYKQVDFIQSTGSQYINTWYKPNGNTRLVATMEVMYGTTSFLFGARANSSANSTSYSFSMPQISGTSLRADYGSAETAIGVSPLQKLTIDVNKNVATVNGTKVSATVQTFQGSYDLALLAVNTAGTVSNMTAARIYSCQIYNGSALVRDFVPAVRSDGVPGLLDRENDVFYPNSGSGTFIVGGLDYTPLEYIDSVGSQYIDTGFCPTNKTRVVSGSAWITANTANSFVLGARSGTTGLLLYNETSASNSYYTMFGSTYATTGVTPTLNTMTIADLNGSTRTVKVNGKSSSLTAATFSLSIPLFLFALNDSWSPLVDGTRRLYGCKIYDDTGRLSLNFVPALCETGAVGLVDKLTGSFYGNSGTGAFLAGPEAVYTKVDYIQSSGTQYIDTRYYPTSNTRVVCSVSGFPRTSGTTLFGARSASSSADRFAFLAAANDSSYRTDFYNSNVSFGTGVNFAGRFIIDKNKATTTLDWTASASNTSGTFSCPYPLFLFAYDTAGTASSFSSAAIYYFQIYESGSLVCDFVPVVRSDGTMGLLDQISGFFYANSGTGTFVAGPTTKYAKVEYLESSGAQHIDTGFAPNQNTRCICNISIGDIASLSNIIPFGSRTSATSGYYYPIIANGYWAYCFGANLVNDGVVNASGRITLDANENTLSVNDQKMSVVNNSFSGTYPIFLFALNNAGAASYNAPCKIHTCQIYNNGALVRDFIPAVRSDGTAGLYDQLNDVFYTNSGTGTFVVGPDLDYTKLEYIESSGTQYINTGFNPNQDTRVVADLQVTRFSGYAPLFGARIASKNAEYATWAIDETTFQDGYGTSMNGTLPGSPLNRNIIDKNKNVFVVDGDTLITHPSATFQSTYPLFVFNINTSGSTTGSFVTYARLYSIQIYNGADTLARNYIPALRENGQIGLIDLVSGLFYANAGSGVFIAGPEIVDPDPPEPPGPYEPPSFTEQTLAYLAALRYPFYKLCRLRFLQPDGSTAFSLDNNPKNKRSGAFVADGSISANLQNGKRRNATVTLSNLDSLFDYNVNTVWFGTEIAIDEGLVLPDGSEYYIQQGVFAIENPTEAVEPANRTATYNLVDKWSYLDGTLFGNLESTYEVPVGTNIFQPIEAILALDRGNGQPVDGVTPIFTEYYNSKTQALPDGSTANLIDSPYTLRIDSDNGTYADVLLGLAAMVNAWIGYDQTGALRIDPSQDDILDTNKPILWQFSMDEATFLGANYTVRNVDVYNDYIVLGELLDDNSQPAGRATNLDPRSDTNVQTIGRKTFRMSAPGFATDKQCQDLAVWKLKRSTSLQKAISISCSQLFHIEENGLVTIVRTDKPGSPVERHLVMGFTRPLTSNGEMQINAVSVQDFVTATVTSWPE